VQHPLPAQSRSQSKTNSSIHHDFVIGLSEIFARWSGLASISFLSIETNWAASLLRPSTAALRRTTTMSEKKAARFARKL